MVEGGGGTTTEPVIAEWRPDVRPAMPPRLLNL